MRPQDVADTLQQLEFIALDEETKEWEFALSQDVLAVYESKKATKLRLPMRGDKLHWEPWKGDTVVEILPASDGSRTPTNPPDIGDEHSVGRLMH